MADQTTTLCQMMNNSSGGVQTTKKRKHPSSKTETRASKRYQRWVAPTLLMGQPGVVTPSPAAATISLNGTTAIISHHVSATPPPTHQSSTTTLNGTTPNVILPLSATTCCRGTALMSQMSRQIYECYLRCRQSNEMYIHKARLREKLYNILRKSFKQGPIDLYIVGSSLNNLGNNHSDVDMCLVLSDRDINQMTEAISILQFVRDQIRIYDFVRKPHLIMAKVPLLKFEDSLSRVEVDLNVNNSVGIRNTHLINCYTRIDRRVQPLVIVVKSWARKRGINNAYNRTLSSYSLVLMVIHYLQCGCKPAVLPCLQQLMPDVFRPDSDIKKLDLHEKLPYFQSKNTQSLSELLIGFLGYYAFTFDYATDVISIRMGRTLDKQTARNYISAKNTPTQWRWICIEEPFDRTNTARSVWDEQAFLGILRVFRSSYYKLRRECNLYSILQ